MKRYTVYVKSVPCIEHQTVVFVVTDAADLQAQLATREAELRATPFNPQPQRKNGAPVLYALNKDWDI
jgi:hypothetical protein